MGWDVYRRNPALEPETIIYRDTRISEGTPLTPTEIAALDAQMKAIKYSTGLTISSLTAKMSLVAPRLVTQSSVDLRPYALTSGTSFSFSDGSKSVVFTGGSAGTGETLSGTELITGFTNKVGVAFDTFATAGADISQAVSNGTTQRYSYSNQITAQSVGALLKRTVTYSKVSGTNPLSYLSVNTYGDSPALDFPVTSPAVYRTVNNTTERYLCYLTSGVNAVDFSAIGNSLQQVLTASTSGANFSALTDGGVNPNIATWTLTITKP